MSIFTKIYKGFVRKAAEDETVRILKTTEYRGESEDYVRNLVKYGKAF